MHFFHDFNRTQNKITKRLIDLHAIFNNGIKHVEEGCRLKNSEFKKKRKKSRHCIKRSKISIIKKNNGYNASHSSTLFEPIE